MLFFLCSVSLSKPLLTPTFILFMFTPIFLFFMFASLSVSQLFHALSLADVEYERAGAIVTEDLSPASLIVGVKEIPIDAIIPERT